MQAPIAVECRSSSCRMWALLAPWQVKSSWTGVEPMSPALAGGFLSTAPGKFHPMLNCALSLSSNTCYNAFLGCWTVAAATAPSQPHDHETLTTILVFTFSTLFNKSHETVCTLLYNSSIVLLDDFAQLQANVSVLSLFRIGWGYAR